MKRMKTFLYSAMGIVALLFFSNKARSVKRPPSYECPADDDYVPDSLAIHHWLS